MGQHPDHSPRLSPPRPFHAPDARDGRGISRRHLDSQRSPVLFLEVTGPVDTSENALAASRPQVNPSGAKGNAMSYELAVVTPAYNETVYDTAAAEARHRKVSKPRRHFLMTACDEGWTVLCPDNSGDAP